MTGLWIVLILAIIQGLTEFFPVSSSGHLVLAETILGADGKLVLPNGVLFELALHIGTLGAVVVVYRKRLTRIFWALILWMRAGLRRKGDFNEDLSYAGWIVVGSIPAGVVGLLFHDTISRAFDFPSMAAFLLVLTGIFLLFGKGRNGDGGFTWSAVLLIGVAQAVAILPGCSRSGWTITTALLLGVGFSRAAEFSFLLSIPAIIGAFIFEFQLSEGLLTSGSVLILFVGGAASFVSGFIALKLLLRILRGGSFYRFSYYLIPTGVAALIFFYYF